MTNYIVKRHSHRNFNRFVYERNCIDWCFEVGIQPLPLLTHRKYPSGFNSLPFLEFLGFLHRLRGEEVTIHERLT